MASQMAFTIKDPMNYSEPDDQEAVLHAQQLVNGALKLDDYRPMQELERIKFDSNQTLERAHFSTPNEKKMAESIQHNTNGWIDTSKDVLCVAIDVGSLVTICGPAIRSGILTPDAMARATQHMLSAGETLKRIYNRSCDMAVDNSNELLLVIDHNEETRQNLLVKTAAEQHRNDLTKFRQGEVNVNVPHQSHAKLRELIDQVEQNQESNVRQTAERSSRAWDTAKYLGSILVAVGAIIGLVLLKR